MIDWILHGTLYNISWYWVVLIGWGVLSIINILFLLPMQMKLCGSRYAKFDNDDIRNCIRWAPFISIWTIMSIVFEFSGKVFGLFEYVPSIINRVYRLGYKEELEDEIEKARR